MILTFLDGRTVNAVILTGTESTMRVALEGAEDILELTNVHGTWVTADCEPVRIGFAWQPRARAVPPSEADCICPQDLAAHLIRSLLSSGDAREWKMGFPFQSFGTSTSMYVS